MKYIKLFENFSNTKIINLIIYFVEIHDDNNIIVLYHGTDKSYAKSIFKNCDSSDLYDSMIYNCYCLFSKILNQYEWLGDIDDEIEDYPINEYYNDSNYYKLIKEGEHEDIDHKDIKSSYEQDEEDNIENFETLKSDITKYLISISSEHKNAGFLNSTFYSLIPYLDGFIQVRIADHFFNLSNINLGRHVIWNFYEGTTIPTEYRNIYGFLSIHLLDKNSNYYKDSSGFRSDFKFAKEYSEFPDLINIIKYDISKDNRNEMDYETDIINTLDDIKIEIDKAMNLGEYNKIDVDDDYIKLEY